MTSGTHLYDVLRRIRPVHELSDRAVRQGLSGTALSVPLRAVVERVVEDGPQPVPALARALFVTRQGVQTLVDEGKSLGYLETRPNPTHRRSHLIALTAAGRTAYEQVHADELTRLDQLAAALDPADVEACTRVLDHLVRGLTAMGTDERTNS